MADDKGKAGYPTIPESNWWSIRNQFKKTLPSNVSINYLKTLLGLTADQAAKNLISPLRSLSIIDEHGAPTDLANRWRQDPTYPQACEEMLKATYPQDLLDLFPEKDFDRTRAREWFKSTRRLGENAANKAASLFAILTSGELKSTNGSPQASVKTSRPRKAIQKSTAQPSPTKIQNPQKPDAPASMEMVTRANPQMAMHIDLQIHISPDASVEQIDAIFASIAKHLYK